MLDVVDALAGIDRGQALTSPWYTDPDVFRAEQRAILRRGWHYVTDAASIAEVGDNHLTDIAGVPVVVLRDRDGEVRGFVNICRHRAHPVVLEAGNRKHLQCHYHGWSYELDGSLLRAPRAEREPEPLDLSGCGLVPVQVAVWGPMIWANVDLDATPFETWIAGLPERIAEHVDLDTCVAGPSHTWEIGCNWKVFQDNTIECYHCPTTHPEFARLVEMNPAVQEMEVGGRFWIHHRIPFRDGVDLGGLLAPEDDGRSYYHYAWIYPGTYLQHYGDRFDIGSVRAVAPDRIRFTHTTFVPHGTSDRAIARLQDMLETDATIHEDVDICHRVQAAHEAGVAPAGTLIPNAEHLLTHLYRVGLELLRSDGVSGPE